MTVTTLPELRLHIYREQPQASRAMNALDAAVADTGLEPSLRHLILLRASQINGCAYCVDMHSKDARRVGESEQRVYGVSAWREAPYYTERERAALALTEAVTLIAGGVPEEVYEEAARQFEPGELAALIWSIAVINTWNRLAVTARDPIPGTYEPGG
jgi:AhpD family alkylhydroperoxidase